LLDVVLAEETVGVTPCTAFDAGETGAEALAAVVPGEAPDIPGSTDEIDCVPVGESAAGADVGVEVDPVGTCETGDDTAWETVLSGP
jgi:hypothetical protein